MQTLVTDYCHKHVDSRRLPRERVLTVVDHPLSAVKYDPLLYSRHNDRDSTVKVGREINLLISENYNYVREIHDGDNHTVSADNVLYKMFML